MCGGEGGDNNYNRKLFGNVVVKGKKKMYTHTHTLQNGCTIEPTLIWRLETHCAVFQKMSEGKTPYHTVPLTCTFSELMPTDHKHVKLINIIEILNLKKQHH